MTKYQFENARRTAIGLHMNEAFFESKNEDATRRQKCAATRRFNMCADLVSIWDLEGFWTAQNTIAYKMLYENQNDLSAVSAY